MYLAQVRAENFRLLHRLSLRPHPRLNLVLGANAAGKTSLLEVIYTLGRAKSFRGSSPAELAGAEGRQWLASGKLVLDGQPETSLGLRWSGGDTEIRYANAYASAAELVRTLPVQILEPGMHRLLQDGPGYRRSFLDWGVFHVEHSFHSTWRRYQRALRQRNIALRSRGADQEVRAWDGELVAAGLELDRLRQQHVTDILKSARSGVKQLLDLDDAQLELRSGWSAGESLAQRLAGQLARDRRMGMTVEGPHRAELLIRLNGHGVKNRVSRGQQKLLIAALLLAQCTLVYQRNGRAPILLVDDFPAELAESFQLRLLAALNNYPGQVFITAFERSGPLSALTEAAMFHVEQGRLTPSSAKIPHHDSSP